VVQVKAKNIDGLWDEDALGFQVYNVPPPEVRIISPVDNHTDVAPATVILDASVGIPNGVSVTRLDYVDANTEAIIQSLDNPNPNSYRYSWTSLLEGVYQVYAIARYSNDMIISSEPITFTITASTIPNTPPFVKLETPNELENQFVSPAVVAFRAEAYDVDEGDSIRLVEFYNGMEMVGEGILNTTSGLYELAWSPVFEGTYRVYAKAYDTRGGSAACQAVDIYVQPAIGNIPPLVEIRSPLNDAVYNTNSNILVQASARDLDGRVVFVDFFF